MDIFMGIDVSKGYADFSIMDASGTGLIESFQVDDTHNGYVALHGVLIDLCEEKDAKIFCAVESTAGYENNWHNYMSHLAATMPIHVVRLNPFGVKKLSEARLERNKTDKTSSYHIAEYLRTYHENIRYDEENPYQAYRKYWTYASLQIKMIRQLSNNLQSTVYCSSPELLHYCKQGFPDWILELLKQYPSARKLCRAKVRGVIKITGVTESKAQKLISAAKTSVASMQDELTEEMVVSLSKQILSMKQHSKNMLRLPLKLYRPREIDLLMTIPGIGEKTALGLFMEIGPVQRFSSSKELASYAGIHPVIRESGDGSKRPRMSKKGRRELRTVLFMPAMVAIQYDEYIKKIYEHHLAKGKSKMCALGIVMHKMLRIAYGVLKSGKPYSADIDQKNSLKKPEKTEPPKKNTIRRFQDLDMSAPVSRRNAKKRKQSVSHSLKAKKGAGSKTAQNNNIENLQPVNIGEKNETIFT